MDLQRWHLDVENLTLTDSVASGKCLRGGLRGTNATLRAVFECHLCQLACSFTLVRDAACLKLREEVSVCR